MLEARQKRVLAQKSLRIESYGLTLSTVQTSAVRDIQ